MSKDPLRILYFSYHLPRGEEPGAFRPWMEAVLALQQAESNTAVAEVARQMGDDETFCRKRKKKDGLRPSEVRQPRQLEEENARRRRPAAEMPPQGAPVSTAGIFASREITQLPWKKFLYGKAFCDM